MPAGSAPPMHDDRLDRRQLVADPGDRLGVGVLDEQHRRLGVGDDPAQLAGPGGS